MIKNELEKADQLLSMRLFTVSKYKQHWFYRSPLVVDRTITSIKYPFHHTDRNNRQGLLRDISHMCCSSIIHLKLWNNSIDSL